DSGHARPGTGPAIASVSLRGYPGGVVPFIQDGARPPRRGRADRSRLTRRVGALRLFLMKPLQTVLENLAAAFLAGEWTAEGLAARGGRAWGRRAAWMGRLAGRLVSHFAEAPRDAAALVSFLGCDAGLRKEWAGCRDRGELPLRQIFWVSEAMAPG